MATKFTTGRGSTFTISVDGGTTWIEVAQLKTTAYSGSKSDLEDITNMDSPGAFREYAPTLLDAGQCAVSGVASPNDPGQLAFNAAYVAQTLVQVKHQYPTAPGFTTGFMRAFSGYVTEDNLDAQFDKASTFTGSIKITGPITDTPATPTA